MIRRLGGYMPSVFLRLAIELGRVTYSSTAKKFLASTNFFELLRIFDRPTETEVCLFFSLRVSAQQVFR